VACELPVRVDPLGMVALLPPIAEVTLVVVVKPETLLCCGIGGGSLAPGPTRIARPAGHGWIRRCSS
jgi:hypothetical protein